MTTDYNIKYTITSSFDIKSDDILVSRILLLEISFANIHALGLQVHFVSDALIGKQIEARADTVHIQEGFN